VPPSDTDGPETAPRPGANAPAEQLPTDRIAFDKQMRLLQAYANVSNGGQNPVTNEDVAKAVEMNSSTVSLANAFFSKMGLLVRSGRAFLPSREVVEFANAMQWAPDEAAKKLAPLFERSWFFATVRPKLSMRPITEDEAVADLGQKAMVGPEYRTQLRMLLAYLVVSGLIRRDGDRYLMPPRRIGDMNAAGTSPGSEPLPTPPPPPAQPQSPGGTDLSGLHPFVQGLLVTLPKPGEDWPLAERKKWLATAESIFGVIYRSGDST
jgi:hypothetical protein